MCISCARVMAARGSPGVRHSGMLAGASTLTLPRRTARPTTVAVRLLAADQVRWGV